MSSVVGVAHHSLAMATQTRKTRPSPPGSKMSRVKARELLSDGDWMFTKVEAGWDAGDFSRHLGVSRGTVRSWLDRHDLIAA